MTITWSFFRNKTQSWWNAEKLARLKAQGWFMLPYWVRYDWVTPNSGTSKREGMPTFSGPLLSKRLPVSFHKIHLQLSDPWSATAFKGGLWNFHFQMLTWLRCTQVSTAAFGWLHFKNAVTACSHIPTLTNICAISCKGKTMLSDFTHQGSHLYFNLWNSTGACGYSNFASKQT